MPFHLYRSSAGSGKTYTLVKEYLKIILERPMHFKNVLAITFTNKAAGEMKERVIRALVDLAAGKDTELRQELDRKFSGAIDLQARSREAINLILHHYSDFGVMTIDSFIHRIIKGFALEIGLPLQFSVDIHSGRMHAFVMEKIIGQIGHDPWLTQHMISFILSRIREDKSWNIEWEVQNFLGEILKEKYAGWLEEISRFGPDDFKELTDSLDHWREDFVQDVSRTAGRAWEQIRKSGLSVKDFFQGDRGPAGTMARLAGFSTGDLKDFELNAYFKKEQWVARSAGKEMQQAIALLAASGLDEAMKSLLELERDRYPRALTAQVIQESMTLLALVHYMKAAVNEYKKLNQVIPISEFNIQVNQIVRNSPVPFIYAIIGEKYLHYLIDEFQDTSRMQWENIFPLVENAMAYDRLNKAVGVAVGDGKQSIYRWRGGEPEIMENEIGAQIGSSQLELHALKKNFRSRRRLVEFYNSCFNFLLERFKEDNPLLTGVYRDLRQEPVKTEEGFVRMDFPDIDSNGEDLDIPLRTAGHIRELTSRGYRWSDIAVLVRTGEEGGKIAEYLLTQDIPVVSAGTLKLAGNPLVEFLLQCLKYLMNPKDEIARLSILLFQAQFSRQNPLDINRLSHYYLSGPEKAFPPELNIFFQSQSWLLRLPIYELLEELIRMFQLDRSLTFQGAAYLQEFLSAVLGFTTENTDDIPSFLDWWSLQGDELHLNFPESKNAIRLMTYWKAKGLEFPAVIIPNLDWQREPAERLWLKASPGLGNHPLLRQLIPVKKTNRLEKTLFARGLELEKERKLVDEINLLYVAFTRATDVLFVIASGKNELVFALHDFAGQKLQKTDAGGPVFFWGSLTERAHSSGIPAEEFCELDRFISGRWFKRISIRRNAEESWLLPGDETAKKIRRGILLHRLLAAITTSRRVQPAIDAACAAGLFSQSDIAGIRQWVEALLRHPAGRDWFNPDFYVQTEAAVATPAGILRPDRLVFTGQRVLVVDFKSGLHVPQHLEQINIYREALQKAQPLPVEAYLCYVPDLDVRRIG